MDETELLKFARELYKFSRPFTKAVHFIGLETFKALEKKVGFDGAMKYIGEGTLTSSELTIYIREKEKEKND